MADPRFFNKAGEFTVAALAKLVGAAILNGEGSKLIKDIAPLSSADTNQLSFLENPKYLSEFVSTKAGAVLVKQEYASKAPAGTVLLISESPYAAYAMIAAKFYPENSASRTFLGTFSENASIHPKSFIGDNVVIEDFAVVCEGAEIGANCFIGAGSYIGKNVKIGNNCTILQKVIITHSILGDGIIIHPGTSIGQDGFGYAMGKVHQKIPQLGRVLIENNVEIGANAAIDRGSGPDTIIGEGTKIDNLVHISHNVKIGNNCVIAGQFGIAGSSQLGDYVITGGQVGIGGHIKIGAGAKIAAQSGVTRNVEAGAEIGGTPSVPLRQYHKQAIALERLVKNKGE